MTECRADYCAVPDLSVLQTSHFNWLVHDNLRFLSGILARAVKEKSCQRQKGKWKNLSKNMSHGLSRNGRFGEAGDLRESLS